MPHKPEETQPIEIIRCYYNDPLKGRVFEEIPSIIESENRTATGRHGLARPASGKGCGFDWYEYSDGTLCHGRRG